MSNNLLDVIRYEGDNNNIVHKHSIQDFNTKSQLIVGESQEALFYKDGQALDLFGSGRHTLNSENLPLLKKIFSFVFGGRNPFQCEVFFINKVTILDFDWGTSAPIVMEDPKYNLIVGVRANGKMGIRVSDSRKFVVKVVGQMNDFGLDAIKKATKGMAMLSIKDTIAKAIGDRGWSVLELPAKLYELSEEIKTKLNANLEPFGLILDNFYVNQVEASDSDLTKLRAAKEKRMEAMTDIDIESIRTVRMGQARAAARAAEGYTYQDERRFDVMQAAAQNEGVAGTVMGAGMGVGMGLGVGGEIGRMTGQAMNPASTGTTGATCTGCGAQLNEGAKFCASCGTPVAPKKQFCESCGAELTPGARFCSGCGAGVAKSTKDEIVNKNCPDCGTSLEGTARFCHVCGHKF